MQNTRFHWEVIIHIIYNINTSNQNKLLMQEKFKKKFGQNYELQFIENLI